VPGALADQAVRHVCEIRHESFQDREYVRLLQRHAIAHCIADSAGLYPCFGDATTDFVYVRLHGSTELYASGYATRELATWASRIRAWTRGEAPSTPARVIDGGHVLRPRPRQVFVYFDNDMKVHAPFDAQNLTRLLEGKRVRKRPTQPDDGWPRAARA
jgi:uncharacterized protein YecE (DUF72 family)